MESCNVKPTQLVLRCYAEQKGDQWQAFCLEFDLAVQADSFKDAKSKLESQIIDYVTDALVGPDREYAGQLLSRKAPFYHWAKWHYYAVAYKYFNVRDGMHRLFKEPMPLVPANA